MTNKILLVFLAILAITFTGCLDIYEEVHVNKDGSGKVTYRYKMQTDMLNGMLGDEFFGGFDGKDSLQLDELKRKGISDVKVVQDGSGFGVSFNFKDINALNNALAIMLGNDSEGGAINNELKQIEGNKTKIHRIAGFLGTDGLKKMMDAKGEEAGLGGMGDMLAKSITYHQIYTFDRKIKDVSNTKAVVSKDKKTMTLDMPFVDMLSGEGTVENTIKLKKGFLWW
jgi:hypothetical protein